MTIRTTTIENGSAAMIAAICSVFNPPACNKRAAIIAIVNPHISFKLFSVISFRYSFALKQQMFFESAEVTKMWLLKLTR